MSEELHDRMQREENERLEKWTPCSAEFAAGRLAGLREAADLLKPASDRPCDCEVGGCYCGNAGDAHHVSSWDEQNANYLMIKRRLALAERGEG